MRPPTCPTSSASAPTPRRSPTTSCVRNSWSHNTPGHRLERAAMAERFAAPWKSLDIHFEGRPAAGADRRVRIAAEGRAEPDQEPARQQLLFDLDNAGLQSIPTISGVD